MARYFTRRMRPKATGWVADDVYCEDGPGHVPEVSEHVAINTGLLDHNGDPIMRSPNPMGFDKDDEW